MINEKTKNENFYPLKRTKSISVHTTDGAKNTVLNQIFNKNVTIRVVFQNFFNFSIEGALYGVESHLSPKALPGEYNWTIEINKSFSKRQYCKKMAEMVKTEEILGQKWDKCVLDAGIKMSSGLAIGKLFKKRDVP